MADVTVTVDSSQVVNASRDINDLIARGQKISEALQKGIIPAGGRKLLGAEDLRALEAYEAKEKNVVKTTDDLAKSSQRAGVNVESMFERMLVRGAIAGVVMGSIRLVMDQVADAIRQASNAQEDFVHWQNLTQESVEQTAGHFDGLKQAAIESNESLEKFTSPLAHRLQEAGVSFADASMEAKDLGQYLRATGVDFSDVAVKVQMGTANVNDFVKASAAISPEWHKAALEFAHAREEEAELNRQLAHQQELEQRVYQDAQRLAGAHEEFASKTGLASAAFEAFQKVQTPAHGAIATRVEIPKALADLPGGGRAFGQLLGEMQKRYGEGINQIAKEENLPAALVRAGVAAGIGGFDEKSLLAAQKRGVEEKNINRERTEADQHWARAEEFEQARIKWNIAIRDLLKEEAGYADEIAKRAVDFARWQGTAAGHSAQVAGFADQTKLAWGDVGRAELGLITGKPGGLGDVGRALTEYPFLSWMRGGGAPAPTTTPTPANNPANPIVEKLDQLMSMLRGHG